MAVSNTAMVLFVLGIVYTVLFVLVIANTGRRLFGCCLSKVKRFMKVYMAFYWFILLQIMMTDSLYWTYFATIIKISSHGD